MQEASLPAPAALGTASQSRHEAAVSSCLASAVSAQCLGGSLHAVSWGKPETDLQRFAVLLHIPAVRAVLIPNQAPFVEIFLLPENKRQEGWNLKVGKTAAVWRTAAKQGRGPWPDPAGRSGQQLCQVTPRQESPEGAILTLSGGSCVMGWALGSSPSSPNALGSRGSVEG